MPPENVVEIPLNGLSKARMLVLFGGPAELVSDFGGVDGVAQVVPGAVGDVGDELFGAAGGPPEFAVEEAAEEPDQLDVGPFVEAAHVIRFADASVVKNSINCAGVVFYPKPIPDVVSFAVNRQWFFV